MSDYDVIVIGAGNGGLTTALPLARAGRKVLLLEKHNIPGGCATSFVRGRFEFEVALHQLSGMGSPDRPGPLRSMLGKLEVLDKLEFVEHHDLYRLIIPDRFDFVMKANREDLVNDLQREFPGEKEAIKNFFDLVYEFCMEMIGGFYLKDPQFSKEKYPVYFKYALRNVQEILDEHFKDPYLKTAVSFYWGYTGVPPSRMPFADLAIMLFAYIEFKPYHLRGGSQALSNALFDGYLNAGGEARFNCEVRKIEVAGGRIEGVITEDGEKITASAVVSNASTVRTYIDLMDQVNIPQSELQSFKTMTIGPSAFTVYLGLDCEPGEIGIHESLNAITSQTDNDRIAQSFRSLEVPGFCGLSCYNECGSAFAPAGTSQVAIVMLQYADPWYTVPAQQYHEVKHRYANAAIDICDRAFPGLRDHIEEAEASTPLTHMHYLGHPGGAIYGQDQLAKDSRFFISNRSPVNGLYFAGSWITMGGFEPTLESGWSTSKAVLAYLDK